TEPLGDPVGRGETERTSAGEHETVDLVDEVAGGEDARPPRARGASSEVARGDRPRRREDDRATGLRGSIRRVPDAITSRESRASARASGHGLRLPAPVSIPTPASP